MRSRPLLQALLMIPLALSLACASSAYNKGMGYLRHGDFDESVPYLEKAYKSSPLTQEYRVDYFRALKAAGQAHFEAAKVALAREDYETTLKELQLSIKFDPMNQYAQDTLAQVVQAIQRKEREQRQMAVTLEDMKKASEQDTGVKKLEPTSNIPIVLKFSGTPIKTVLDALSKASGVNFLYDEKVDTQKKITVDFSNTTLEAALDFIMMQTKHFYKVLDPHTLIVIPDSKQKREEYDEQVMRTFYLSNADAKDVFQLVRSIIQGKKMAMNQDLNSITIKDSPETVALTQKIIEANDKSKGEVVIDVQLIEVDRSSTLNIGIDLSQANQFTLGPGINVGTDKDGNSTWISPGPQPIGKAFGSYHQGIWISPIPNIMVNLMLSDSEAKVLAKPQLRVMEGKKASVHIGDRIPVPTANLSYTTTTTTNYTPMTSYTYQDVGVKIEVEPRVHHNKEITLKLTAEISAVTRYIPAEGVNPAQPVIGSRKVQTEIRLEDGETSLLAGLIREEDKEGLSGLPGLSQIPILKYLFSNTTKEKTTNDIVLLLTPHIIRTPNITQDDLRPLWVGTEDRPRLEGFRETSFEKSPFEGAEPAASPDAKGKEKEAPAAEKEKAEEPAGEEDAEDEAELGPETEAPAAGATTDETKGGEDKPTQQQARLLVSPTNFQTAAGSQAIINLVVVGATNVKGLKVEMDFPTDILKYEGAEEGSFLKMGGGVSAFNAAEARPGLLVLEMGRSDGGSSSGSGLVARIRMRAASAGQARANFGTAQVIDTSGQATQMAPAFSMITVVAGPAPGDTKPGG